MENADMSFVEVYRIHSAKKKNIFKQKCAGLCFISRLFLSSIRYEVVINENCSSVGILYYIKEIQWSVWEACLNCYSLKQEETTSIKTHT